MCIFNVCTCLLQKKNKYVKKQTKKMSSQVYLIQMLVVGLIQQIKSSISHLLN